MQFDGVKLLGPLAIDGVHVVVGKVRWIVGVRGTLCDVSYSLLARAYGDAKNSTRFRDR